jgi:ParB family transcriptional regulator, chromosome partitioning protein
MSPAVASVARTTKVKPPKGERQGVSPPSTPVGNDQEILIDSIRISHNDRTEFDAKAIATLATSISERGLDNPITVRCVVDPVDGTKEYELIAGERRLRACKFILKLKTIRARIIAADDKSADLLRLEENLLREDLNQIDRAAGLKRYIEKHGESQSAVGKRFGMTQAQVSNLLRLLQLPAVWQEMVKTGEIPHTVVRDVLAT